MILKHYYWHYSQGLPKELCDKIIKEANKEKKQIALTGDYKTEDLKDNEKLKSLKKQRDCNIKWLDKKWLYDLMHPFIMDVNSSAGWNFDVNFTEKAQFTIYGKNQYYGWHHDQFENPHNYPQYPDMNGKIRKLSMSILLNDPKEYEGGVLEFDTPNGLFQCKELIQKGSLVIFPSFIKHRVTPITKGKRLSLVSWTLGYPYR